MKKIIFIITLSVVSIFAKPCMTDIYFGNGVWNTPTQASKSLERLRKFTLSAYNARLDRNKEGDTYQFMPPIYNPTRGTIEDLLETFWQLKESGQISEGYFMAKWNLLTADRGSDELRKAIDRVATTNTVDVNRMYNTYTNTSFSKKHNVLLVAHSQGNLFGNQMYTMFTDAQKKKFRMVSVATPANHVMKPDQTVPYVTARNDYVINRISGALIGNVDGFGHTFIGTYLGSSFEARTQIALYVKSAYDNLMQTTSCNKYWALSMTLHTEGTMEVFGYPILGGRDVYVADSIGIVDFKPYDMKIKKDANGNIVKICGINPSSVKVWRDIDLCYNSSDDNTCGWKAGEIYSKSTLEARKNLNYVMLSEDKKKCINISHSGELYDLTKDLFE